MNLETYALIDDQMILQDQELGLDLVLPFTLPRLPQELALPQECDSGILLVLERDSIGILRAAFLTHEGKRNGQCKLFYEEGLVQAEMFYKQGELHGPSHFYSETGEVLSRVFFNEGKRIGKGHFYFLSGKPASTQRFKEGQWDGLQEYFYETGVPKSLIPYQLGKLHGQVQLFWENGQLKRQTDYHEGVREGKDLIWNERGILVDEAEYRGGQPSGIHHQFFQDGKCSQEWVYHTQVRFDKKQWDPFGKLVLEGTWAPDLTYTERTYQETGGALVRKGYWDGLKLRWK